MSNVIAWPAPAGEAASPDYTLQVDGQSVFVYQAKVRTEILQHPGLWTHKADAPGERASFAIFDLAGPAVVEVRPARPFRTAKVLPSRAGVSAEVADGCIRLRLAEPRHLTLLLDGDDRQPLHLFIGSPQRDVPDPHDPNVVYFGPGLHEIDTLDVRSGQTVHLAGGAVVKARLRPGESGRYSDKWKVTYYSGTVLNLHEVSGVRICGRGILDGSLVPHPGRNLIGVRQSKDIRIEGITLRDSPNWNVIVQKSQRVVVEDVRIISGRLNSDGINSVNSQDVAVRGCFVRNHDDSIVAKATEPGRPCEDIAVSDCVVWNDWGYALGATYETRSPIRRVSFRRCDVLFSRHWCMGVHVSDAGPVMDVTFADVAVEDLTHTSPPGEAYRGLAGRPKLLRMVITKDVWGHDEQPGAIAGVIVENVTVHGPQMLASELLGFDEGHGISDVRIRNVRLAGQPPASDADTLKLTTKYVRQLQIEPGE